MLEIEEDILYAYGFFPHSIWQLLHPRKQAGLTALEKKVLQLAGRMGELHPRDLEAHLGRKRVVNAWGGYSKTTTRALDELQYRGFLRVARREHGIRVYQAITPAAEVLPPHERVRRLILLIVRLLAPVPQKTLTALIARFRHLGNPRALLEDLCRTGELRREATEGLIYIWPIDHDVQVEPSREVWLLAPFDPLVWDRRRFEHFWGWPYRFEAYTPVAKRVRGYYALPLLWGDVVIGWANARMENGQLNIAFGFIGTKPRARAFAAALDVEVERMRYFLARQNASSASMENSSKKT
jgi:uncharacterized protein YcaQ